MAMIPEMMVNLSSLARFRVIVEIGLWPREKQKTYHKCGQYHSIFWGLGGGDPGQEKDEHKHSSVCLV